MPLSYHTNPNARSIAGGKRPISAKTSNHTVLVGESGTIFTTEGADGEVVFTLPAVAAGLYFSFYSAENQDLVVAAPSANTLIAFNNVAATQVSLGTSNQKAGGGFNVWSDGAKWMVAPTVDPGATITVE